MRLHDPYAGILLKLERLRQDKGQKEICYGICVPSYLSKIERNLVQADEDILQQLFERLGIKYCSDDKFIETAERLIDDYFEGCLYGIGNKAFDKLKQISTSLNYSPLAVDWLLVQGCHGDESALPLLSELEDVMTDRQLAYYYILHTLKKENSEQVLTLYKKAHGILNNSFSLLHLMSAYFDLGKYDKVNEYADQCISLALEEGNTWSIFRCFQMQGSVYACLNIDSMMLQFYKRCINLLQNTMWKENLWDVYYNIGSTYLHSGKYELAMEYLNKVPEDWDVFLLNHKKALAEIRSGHRDKAEEFLETMKKWLLNKHSAQEDIKVEKLMYEETLMEMSENFLLDPKYLNMLENLISVLKEQRHPGYYLFYRDLLKEAYCRQRKYKKALELDNTISSEMKKYML